MKYFEELNLKSKRIVYAVGDIHGRFNALDKMLEDIRFDKEQDFLISVGDLVDRGDSNERCVDYIGKPWFKHILGNHELMAKEHLEGNSGLHTMNGGGWLAKLGQDEQRKVVDALMDAPMMLEVRTPKGYHCGFVHADLPYKDWADNVYDAERIEHSLLWSRTTVANMKKNPDYDCTIKGIDKVFFGHNAMYNAFKRDNCYWIDTGSGFSDGKLTIVNVDADTFYTEK